MPCMQQPEAYVAKVADLLDDQGKVKAGSTRDFLQKFAAAFGAWIDHVALAHDSAA